MVRSEGLQIQGRNRNPTPFVRHIFSIWTTSCYYGIPTLFFWAVHVATQHTAGPQRDTDILFEDIRVAVRVHRFDVTDSVGHFDGGMFVDVDVRR